MRETIIISGFPGIGKTYLVKKCQHLLIADSDSSNFSWIVNELGERERDPSFPLNYIIHIKECSKYFNIILVSSHKEVRDSLVKNNIWFNLVYPHKSLKEEYLLRYKNRGSDKMFLTLLNSKWDEFIDDIEEQKKCHRVCLQEGEYLSDVFLNTLDSTIL